MNINYYCLSLQKKIFDRFLVVKKESFDRNNIDIIKFKGIDGNHFKSCYEISKKYNIELGNKINKCSPILVAIAQSHRNIWKKISKDRKNSYNVIFEDDMLHRVKSNEEALRISLAFNYRKCVSWYGIKETNKEKTND